jgi:hypothetical protein
MSVMTLPQIEKNVSLLSLEDQLLLLERIIHRLRKKDMKDENILDSQVAAMASDQEIQTKLQRINEEFAFTESDGLEKIGDRPG